MAGTGKMGMSRKRLDKAKGVTKAAFQYGTVPGLQYTAAKKITEGAKAKAKKKIARSTSPNAPKRLSPTQARMARYKR